MDIDNQSATQCKRGHIRTGENTYTNPVSRSKECLTCKRQRAKNRYTEQKAKMDAIHAAIQQGIAEAQSEAKQAHIDSQAHATCHQEPEEVESVADKLDKLIGAEVDKALAEGERWTPELQHRIEQQFGLK